MKEEDFIPILVEKGHITRVECIEFDSDHHRFMEFWDLNDHTYVTSYDIRYTDVEEVSSTGAVRMVRRSETTKRHLCKCRVFGEICHDGKNTREVMSI